jgi:hypothetical protein
MHLSKEHLLLLLGGNIGPLEEIKRLYSQRDRAALEWKAKGGKVV